jgi:hypothetical protein
MKYFTIAENNCEQLYIRYDVQVIFEFSYKFTVSFQADDFG